MLAEAGVILGEEAHIRSGKENGPRYDPDYPEDKIDSYENLILLCRNHHGLIDKGGCSSFPVDALESMRREHEEHVTKGLSRSETEAREFEERLTAAIGYWESEFAAHWELISASLNGPQPKITASNHDQLLSLGSWLLAKDWPADYPKLRMAFGRFREILNLLLEFIHNNFHEPTNGIWLELERLHKQLQTWDTDRYNELLTQLQLNQAVVWFCTTELTRAGNLVIDAVRSELDPLYRFDAGVLLMRDGDGLIDNLIVRVEYRHVDWGTAFPTLSLSELEKKICSIAERKKATPDRVHPQDVYEL